MKKIAAGLAVSLLVLSLLVVVGLRSGIIKGKTRSQPATSTPTASTPATTTISPNKRLMNRWLTSYGIFFTTLINDAQKTLDYLKNENIAYAVEACPQLRCDMATLQGRPPPVDSLAFSRGVEAAPSGYRCPPIPDAQSVADLNAGIAQLETAIAHLINGENRFDGEMIRSAEPEMEAAIKTLSKVSEDFGKVQ